MTLRSIVLLCCAIVAIAARPAAADTRLQRYALIVGANFGGADRPLLKYGVSDAERFARVMVDLGGVAPEHNTVLRQPKLRELLDAIDLLTRRVTEVNGALLLQLAQRTSPSSQSNSEVLRVSDTAQRLHRSMTASVLTRPAPASFRPRSFTATDSESTSSDAVAASPP